MPSERTTSGPRPGPLAEGLRAGLCLFAADWAAAGVHRTPAAVVLFSAALFALGGLAAGVAGRLFRSRGAATGLALGGALLVHAASLVSKEVAGPERAGAFAAGAAAAAAFGLLAALALRRCERDERGLVLLLAALVPAASVVHFAVDGGTARTVASTALPLAPAVLLVLVRPRRRGVLSAAGGVALVALALPVALIDREPPRRFVPASARVEPPPGAPNVALVLIDTLRADHFGAGDTPALERLAQGGVRFTQAVSTASWTLPSTSSILTSLLPSQHGAVLATTALAGDVTTLAEVFQAAGYETAAFTGGAFVSPAFGLDQGFEYFDHLAEFEFRPFRVHVPLAWRVAKNRYLPLRPLLGVVSEFGGARAVREHVERWLGARDPSRPFLLLVHTYQVHDYYIYHADPDDELRARGEALSEAFAGRLSVHPSELATASQADLDWFHELYRLRLAHVDRELGLLLDELRAHAGGELVVALTSDHGEGFDAAHERVHHGGRLHDDLLRVPLVLAAPGLEGGRTVDRQVSTLDVMPTLIDLAGLEPPAETIGAMVGRSLLGPLAGREPWPPLSFAEDRAARGPQRAVRTLEWKLIEGPRGRETYDLSADPAELRSLRASPGAPPAELQRELEGFSERFPERPLRSTALDEATLDHLRDLGYVD